jgi:hypothetical protein
MNKNLKGLFDQPGIIGIVADKHKGKSNTAHYIIKKLREFGTFNLKHYGFTYDPGGLAIGSLNELEKCKNSVIFLDEFYFLLDLQNRKNQHQIDAIFQTLYHPDRNNVVSLIGIPQNFNKFICEKLTAAIFKECTLKAFVNGSAIKEMCLNYKEKNTPGCRGVGATTLFVDVDKALVYNPMNEKEYTVVDIEYIKEADMKRFNPPIITPKAK